MLKFIMRSMLFKLIAITGFSTLFVVGVAFTGYWNAWNDVYSFRTLNEGTINNERTILHMTVAFKKQVQEWKDTILRGSDPQKLDKYWGKFTEQESLVQRLGEGLKGRLNDPAAEDLLDQFLAAHKTMGENYRNGLDKYKASGFISQVADASVAGMDRPPTQLLEKAVTILADDSRSQVSKSLDDSQRGIILSLIVMTVMIIVAFVVFLWFIRRYIIRPSHNLRDDLARLASGDFSQDIISSSDDELGQIAESAKQVQQSLGETIKHLSMASEQISRSSQQLTAVVDETHEGVAQQRQQTEMVATAMNQMVATVQEVSRSANQAAENTHNANDQATTGKHIISTATTSINNLAAGVENASMVIQRLETHSNSIGTVLDVIRDIAEQTNLLALNAAIEAARAGDQGRGFAVVADEVRTLAQRTQESTSEIQKMIQQLQSGTREAVEVITDSSNNARATVEHTIKANEALESIVNAIRSISEMNLQIATATEEQNAVAEEIERSISAISQTAELNASGTEKTANSNHELALLSEQLQSVSSRFKI